MLCGHKIRAFWPPLLSFKYVCHNFLYITLSQINVTCLKEKYNTISICLVILLVRVAYIKRITYQKVKSYVLNSFIIGYCSYLLHFCLTIN